MDHRSFRLPAVHELIGAGEGWKPVLWGDLAGLELPDLLSVLAHARRTGLLLVRCGENSERALAVVDGRVTWAASSDPAERDVRDVCYGLVRLHGGLFTMLAAPAGKLPAGNGVSTHELLLDGLRRLDEERVVPRNPGRPPK
jgi:hypothetical protein